MFNSELTDERVAGYWDALCDLSLESVQYACQHAARYFQPAAHERLPAAGTLREYARIWRQEQVMAKQLAQASEPSFQEGLAALRTISKMLEAKMEMATAQPPPPLDDAERERLIAEGQLNPPDPTRWLPLTEDFGEDDRKPRREREEGKS